MNNNALMDKKLKGQSENLQAELAQCYTTFQQLKDNAGVTEIFEEAMRKEKVTSFNDFKENMMDLARNKNNPEILLNVEGFLNAAEQLNNRHVDVLSLFQKEIKGKPIDENDINDIVHKVMEANGLGNLVEHLNIEEEKAQVNEKQLDAPVSDVVVPVASVSNDTVSANDGQVSNVIEPVAPKPLSAEEVQLIAQQKNEANEIYKKLGKMGEEFNKYVELESLPYVNCLKEFKQDVTHRNIAEFNKVVQKSKLSDDFKKFFAAFSEGVIDLNTIKQKTQDKELKEAIGTYFESFDKGFKNTHEKANQNVASQLSKQTMLERITNAITRIIQAIIELLKKIFMKTGQVLKSAYEKITTNETDEMYKRAEKYQKDNPNIQKDNPSFDPKGMTVGKIDSEEPKGPSVGATNTHESEPEFKNPSSMKPKIA